MNVEIGPEAAQFPFWKYILSNFRDCVFAVHKGLIDETLILRCCPPQRQLHPRQLGLIFRNHSP